jgi:TolB-like protein/Tfp pilus assembly protein PilF
MTVIYIVAAWVAVQIASEAFPALNIPEGAIRYVWIAVLVGFPITVLFSWKYDLTASGIQRTPAAREDLETDRSLTRVDYGILAALGLVVLATIVSVGQRLIEVQTEVAQAPTTRVIDPNSIAVLPLESLSPNPDDAYFAAGVHDALITSLSKITALMVTSRTSTLRVNSSLSMPEIGRQLGVAKLLEGSVLMDGDRVRVIVQLIDAATDLHLWADTYERDITDIIGLQNEVAHTIADTIEVRLTPREKAALVAANPVRPDTYREYLKGMYQFRQDTPEADLRGVEILKEVVRQDPGSALAYAGEAHLSVGMYRLMYEWDFEGAEQAYKRAIELSPSLSLAHYQLAWLYELLGPEWEKESLASGDRSLELDPLSAFMLAGLAWQYSDACRYDEALRLAREAIRLDPDYPLGWAILGLLYAELGQFDEALDAHRRLEGTIWAYTLGMSYAIAGLEDKAHEVAAPLEKVPGAELAVAWIFMNLGDRDAALAWIAKTEKARTPWYPWLLGNFIGSDLIANDPRLQARAAALGLPDPRTMGCGY